MIYHGLILILQELHGLKMVCIEKSYNPKGATGFGIRTIVKLLGDNSLNK